MTQFWHGLRACVWLLCWCASGSPVAAWAWSASGHGDIAQAALMALPQAQQRHYQAILQAGPWSSSDGQARAAEAAVWPDRVRDTPLRKLFKTHGSGTVPQALRPYARKNTRDWHYANALFVVDTDVVDGRRDQRRIVAASESGAGTCPPPMTGALLEVWPRLLLAYQQATQARDRALLLAFILHLGADAYQPMHVLSGLSDTCVSDRGGNGYCLNPPTGLQRPDGRCQLTLHRHWDRAFRLFDAEGNWVQPRQRLPGDYRDLRLALDFVQPWAAEVYPQTPRQATTKAYEARSRAHLARAANRAVDHLAETLAALAADIL